MTTNNLDTTRPRQFRRTVLATSLLQALLPVALSFTPTLTAAQDKPSPRSPFSVDRLPSLGSDPAPAPDELRAARQARDGTAGQDEQARTVASAASSAGGLLQGSRPGDAAASMARGMATGEASRQASDWLKNFGNARVQLNMNEDFSLKNSQFDLLHPWWEVPDAMLFSQGSLHRTDDRTQANLGFGWRHWTDGSAPYGILSGPYMTGLNTFLDYDLSRDHARLGVGAEFWRDYFKAGANVYHRLTNWKNSPDIEDYEERPADGWDIRTEGWLPAYPQLGAKLVYEQYYGHDVGLFGYDNLQKDPHAFTAGLTWTPFPLLTLSAEQRQGKQGENDTRIGLDFTWHPDMSWQQQTSPDAVGALRTLSGNRHDFIERNNNIVLEYRKKEVLAISLPERVEGKSGMQYPLTVTVSKAKYGLQRVDWDDAAFLAAGGQLTCTGETACTVKMPPFQVNGANTWTLSAVGYDRRGNASPRVQTTLVVTGVGVSAADSSLTPAEGTLLADGKTQTVVTAVLKSEDGQPVSGLAGQLSLSGVLTPDSHVVDVKAVRRPAPQTTAPALTSLQETQPGTYTATLTAGTTAGKYALSLAVNGDRLLASEVTLTDTLADLGQSTLTADKATVMAGDGTDPANTVTLTAEMKDKNGQPVQQDPARTAFFIDGSDRGAVDISRPQADPARPGVLTATVSSPAALDAVKVGLKINGKDTGKRVTLSFTPELTSLAPVLTADKNNVVADGKTPVTLTVVTQDRFGNPVGNQAVTLSTADATAVLADTTVTTGAAGEGRTTLTATTPGEKTVTAEVNGQQATAKVWFVADAATAKVDSLTADVAEQTVGDGHDRVIVLTALVTDGLNNPVTGAKVDWQQDGGDGYQLSAAATTTDDQGKTTVTMTAPAHQAGSNLTVTAQTGAGAAQTTKVSWLADAARAAVTTTTLDDPSVTEHKADGVESFAWTAQVSDPYGNPVTDSTVKWTSSVGAVTLSAAETKTDANGHARVTAHSTVAAGNVVVSAQAVSGAAVPSAPVAFTADVANAKLGVTVTKDNAVADNTDRVTLHVKLADPAGAAIPAQTLKVDLSASPDMVTADGSTTYTLDSKGELDLQLKTTRAGSHELTLTAELQATGTETSVAESVTFVAGPVVAANSEIIVPVPAASEGDPLTVQVYPRDQYNNDIPLAAVKDQLTVTPTATGVVLNTTWQQGTEAAGNPVITGTLAPTPASFNTAIRSNTIAVAVNGTAIGMPQKAAWAPALRSSTDMSSPGYTADDIASIGAANTVMLFSRTGGQAGGYELAGLLDPASPEARTLGDDPVSGAPVVVIYDRYPATDYATTDRAIEPTGGFADARKTHQQVIYRTDVHGGDVEDLVGIAGTPFVEEPGPSDATPIGPRAKATGVKEIYPPLERRIGTVTMWFELESGSPSTVPWTSVWDLKASSDYFMVPTACSGSGRVRVSALGITLEDVTAHVIANDDMVPFLGAVLGSRMTIRNHLTAAYAEPYGAAMLRTAAAGRAVWMSASASCPESADAHTAYGIIFDHTREQQLSPKAVDNALAHSVRLSVQNNYTADRPTRVISAQ
ncbi:hypothetical protein DO259_22680 [Salmonella enterica]|nr:hypothetical protein [Salmonella enterica]